MSPGVLFRVLTGQSLLLLAVTGCGPTVDAVSVSGERAGEVEAARPVTASAGDWPWWRGPTWDGRAEPQQVPIRWSETENVQWKVPLLGRGHASPIVVGDQVFIATADIESERMLLLCLRRDSGERVWEHVIHQGAFMHAHEKNSHASATPAWDGRNIISVFMVGDALYVTAVDREGQQVWQTNTGPFRSKHGYGSSPLLYKSLVIVNGDNHGSGFLVALDRVTGEIVWRVNRPNNASFASPVIAHLSGQDQLLLSGLQEVCSYAPSTGELLWKSEGPATVTANTIVWHEGLVFASGGWPEQNLMAIRSDGSGEVVWSERLKAYVPSPLIIGDKLLVTLDNNIVQCFEAMTGESIWKKRLGSRGFSASPTSVGDVVYLPDETGNVFVFRVGDEFQLLAENTIDGDGMASPVICGDQIFLRSSNSLYCISTPDDTQTARHH